MAAFDTAEHRRLNETHDGSAGWKVWGPYLSERQWGTVREDYSDSGDAWSYFSHDESRSRAYRWGEDGILGISDDKQRLCFALALWNGNDSILKERLFGLTNAEGNHGEDVKEYYYYLDSTPTHAYMRGLYKYPQAAYPYADLVDTSRARNRLEMEYELLDTGVFDDDRYFDVEVEYAKAAPQDIAIRISAHNRGPEAATLHLLPTLWFRNTWSWLGEEKPTLWELATPDGSRVVQMTHQALGERYLYCEGDAPLLFTDNETNRERVWGQPNAGPFVKDGINDAVVLGRGEAVNADGFGTKVAPHYVLEIAAGGSASVRLRLTDLAPALVGQLGGPLANVDALIAERRAEADTFYASITPPALSADEASVMRQALAGMLWTKQYYYFDLSRWLDEHDAHPMRAGRREIRNKQWFHMLNDDIISMPDKWEYPWYAAWDLAFHTIALAMVDIDFAKQQLDLMLREIYLHPNGQIPAYEWNFGDVNPPVHAWATLVVYQYEREQRGTGDSEFLKHAFNKLLLNFTWWVNRKDPAGHNVFEGGFLGLDNIGVFDRSAPLPTGGHLEQADGTAWMAFFCQCMLGIALELSREDPDYADIIPKFVEHFMWIAASMDRLDDNDTDLWDDEDGFFYDVLRLPDGSAKRLQVRSLVGLLPLCASVVIEAEDRERFPQIIGRVLNFIDRNRDLGATIASPRTPGVNDRRLLAILPEDKLRRVLERMLDEERFLAPHGIRSLSRWHLEHPYQFAVHGQQYEVKYLPAESDSGMFGGNSNWRGPIWFPVNMLLIRALGQLYLYYGDDFKVECPTGSGVQMTLFEVARELARRLTSIFLLDAEGRRPVFGGNERLQTDPHWRDHVLFYEYFHGDNGAGIGASHQTGWTGLAARLLQMLGYMEAGSLLDRGMVASLVYTGEPTPTAGEE